jgi:hypothetical protein
LAKAQTAWQGTVEVFDLVSHRKAKRAYAWSYRDGDQNKTVAVLEGPACGFTAERRQSGDCE